MPDTPKACCCTAGVYLDGKYYQVCGKDFDFFKYPKMQVFDGSSWQEIGTHPAGGVWLHSATVWNNKIVVSGGVTSEDPTSYNFTTIFNPTDASWIPSTPMPVENNAGTAMACVNEKCYLFGGYQDQTGVYSWTPGDANMSLRAALPEGRTDHCVAVYNGNIYLFGGKFSGMQRNTIFMYNPSSNVWTIKSATLNPPVFNATAVTIGERIYIIGGAADGLIGNTVQVYNPLNDTISAGPPLLFSTYAHAAAGTTIINENGMYTGKIYVSGGSIAGFLWPIHTFNIGNVVGNAPFTIEPSSLGIIKSLYY
jgi:N-acetylneuraminic acid mutarotase